MDFLPRRYNREPDHTQGEGKNEEEFLKDIDATPNYRALLMVRHKQVPMDVETVQPLGRKLKVSTTGLC